MSGEHPTTRRRVQPVLEYFGLAEREGEGTSAEDAKPDWAYIFFAVMIPVWASGHVHGAWLALYAALGVPGGLVEVARWSLGAPDGGRVVEALRIVQALPMSALVVLLLFGDHVGAGHALAYSAAMFAGVLVALQVGGRVRQRRGAASPAAGR